MFHRILVATDGSPRAANAFAGACALARQSGSEIVLLMVLHVVATNDEFEKAHQMLGKLADEGRAKGVNGRTLVAFGEPDEAISMVARDEQCDLIVVAAQPRRGLEVLVHPRLTPHLEAHAAMPVLIWPEGVAAEAIEAPLAHVGAPVLAPLDGSAYAEEALPLATELARKFGRTLMLIRVIEPVDSAITGTEAADIVGLEANNAERTAREYLTTIRQSIAAKTGLRVEAILRQGDAAERILHIAETHPSSLIVMTTHGRRGLDRFFVGSVTGDVVRRAHAPVLVIPPGVVHNVAMPYSDKLVVDAVEH